MPKENLQEAILDIVNNMDAHIRAILIRSKLCRAYYMGLVKEGFTEMQALEICKHFNM